MNIELIYDDDCPNTNSARIVLKQALDDLRLNFSWKEWNRSKVDAPPFVLQFGSPTILINRCDVAGTEPQKDGINCCRLYEDNAGTLKKVPSLERIVQAIQDALISK